MTGKARKEDFLSKAKEAEQHAAKAKDEQSKAEWLRIAAGYHGLAARHDQKP